MAALEAPCEPNHLCTGIELDRKPVQLWFIPWPGPDPPVKGTYQTSGQACTIV